MAKYGAAAPRSIRSVMKRYLALVAVLFATTSLAADTYSLGSSRNVAPP